MAAKIISGTQIAKQIREELKAEVAEMKEKHGVTPGLVTILVGENPASISYVTAKQRTAHDLAFHSIQDNQPEDISEADLLALIDRYNQDPVFHGILIQLPLPKHIDDGKVIYAVNPDKDVDGFHPVNVGKMVVGEPCFLPCTPHGIMEMLIRSEVETSGAEAVIVGRSNIVGKPIANLLLQKREGGNATVTLCHTRTKDVAFHTKRADILRRRSGYRRRCKPDRQDP